MSLRTALAGLLAVIAAASGQPRPAAPPLMLGPSYAGNLRGVLEMEDADAARLEKQLAGRPDDLATRLKLMAYYQRQDRASRPEDRRKRFEHVLWLVRHHPESEILHSPLSRFAPGELSSEQRHRVTNAWDAAAAARPRDAAVLWNAACFFEGLDPARYLRYLERTAAADSNHPFALRPLAHYYALAILEGGAPAAHARSALDASQNVWVLGNAAYMLQSQYNLSVQMGRPNPRASELAKKYFERATALDPNLDRNAILPRIDMRAIAQARAREQRSQQDRDARADAAALKIRRVTLEAFPQLPPAVARVLRARNCRVPQPAANGSPRNVIRGEFYAKGEMGWAVLCSVNNSTALLVFRNGADTRPETLNTSEDRGYLQMLDGDRFLYSREIKPVGRDFIMGHYRAYGGPEPPPIDHQGIDDAFLEKASLIWYYYGGRWLRLQGAD
jgi:hypothetical protein